MKKNNPLRSGLRPLLAAGAACLGLSMPVIAQELRVAQPLLVNNPYYKGYEAFVDYLNKNSDLNVKMYGPELLTAAEVGAGIRDGIVAAGFIITAYLPTEYSEANLMGNLGMLATSGKPAKSPHAAMSGAMMEYVLFNCPDCIEQFKNYNQLFLSSSASAPYSLICNKPIRTLADMKGKKFRSGASNHTRWAEKAGAIAVSMPSPETFDALSQGVLDCTMLSHADIKSVGLEEVVSFALLNAPGGVFSGIASDNVNLDTWRSLTPEQRKVFIEASVQLVGASLQATNDNIAAAADVAKANDIEFLDANQEILDFNSAFVDEDMAVLVKQFEEKYQLKNSAEKIATAVALIDKWKDLTNAVDSNDIEALKDLYRKEIFSKIDANYGL